MHERERSRRTRQVVGMLQPHHWRLLTFATAEAAVSMTAETTPSDRADVMKCAEYDQHLAVWSLGEKYIIHCLAKRLIINRLWLLYSSADFDNFSNLEC